MQSSGLLLNLVGLVYILTALAPLIQGFNEKKKDLQDGDVKLVDGSSKQEGTILVFRGYAWGTICDDDWSIQAGNVVCRQMGMSHALTVSKNNKYGSRGLPHFLLDNVNCRGNESRISDCRHNGWAQHDCQRRELAGVQCAVMAIKERLPDWNPLNLPLSKDQIMTMRNTAFTYKVEKLNSPTEDSDTFLLLASVGEVRGAFCPDTFLAIEGNVVCQQHFNGFFSQQVKHIPISQFPSQYQKQIVLVGRCYGNESSLQSCLTYSALKGSVPCKLNSVAVGVKCTAVLSDIRPDAGELERSSYLSRMPIWHLECALSENCLPDDVYSIIEQHPHTYAWITRTLLRFSSIIENVGDADFLPFEDSSNWEWHACHFHYHSMKVFARYEVIDKDKQVIASGHKASFCLEDNYCKKGLGPKFRCSNVIDNKGTQGISPGCKDTYLHDYDCQWIDLTNLKSGVYTYQMVINPEFLVSESNFFNNGVVCRLHYFGVNAVLRNCHLQHPNDLF